MGHILAYCLILCSGLLHSTDDDAPADAWDIFHLTSTDDTQPVSAVSDLQKCKDTGDQAPAALKAERGEKSETKDKTAEKSVIRRETDGADIIPGLEHAATGIDSLDAAYQNIRAAQIHLRFGVAEFGNVKAFTEAERLLISSRESLSGLRESWLNSRQAQQRDDLNRIVEHLLRELAELQTDAQATFAGRFPLMRAFGLELTDEKDEQVHAYHVPHVAHRKAMYDALLKVSKTASADALLVLVMAPNEAGRSQPAASLAELADSQARIAFRTLPNVTVIQGSLRQRLDAMPAWDAPDRAFQPICQQILKELKITEQKSMMLVLVREFIPETRDGYWIQAQQRTYGSSALKDAEDDPDELEADKVRFSEAFSRDQSASRSMIICGMSVLAIIAMLGYAYCAERGSPTAHWLSRLVIPAAGYLIGLILSPLVVLAMSSGMPDPQSSALSSLWWPSTTGALSLILPSGVIRLAAGTAGRYLPSLSCHGMWGLAFVPVAVGVAAGWVAPATAVLGWGAIPLILSLTAAGGILLYCFGRATDMADDFPMSFTPIALGLSLPFGAGAFLGSTPLILGVATVMTLVLGAYWLRKSGRMNFPVAKPINTVHSHATAPAARVPRTLAELERALQKPQYQPSEELKDFQKLMEQLCEGKSLWMGLVGPSAAGKSAAVEFIVQQLKQRRPDLILLAGRCTEKSSAYQPFREALAEMGVPQQILTSRTQGGGMNDLFDRLADRFIPFWDFFSGYRDRVEEDDDDEAAAPPELLAAVSKALRSAAKPNSVVLFIDDVQWIDEWSVQVLEHLREQFPPGGETPCLIVLAAREETALDRFELTEDQVVVLSPPDAKRQRQILVKSLGIAAPSAKRIVEAIGRLGQEPGGMFWLLRAVQELLKEHALAPTPQGFTLRRRELRGDDLPVPDAMRNELAAQLRSSEKHRPILECAALLGEKFRVSDLAECLQMDRLELLHVLRSLEEQHQVLHDLPADPDYYAFSSSFILRILRDELQISAGEHRDPKPTKIAREWHARIARVLEQRSPRTTQLTLALANHYFQAGAGCESKAMEYCLLAARTALRAQRMDEAEIMLLKAQQAAQSGKVPWPPDQLAEFAADLERQPAAAVSTEGQPEVARPATENGRAPASAALASQNG